jgi:branched-chain amino acid transport system permease protein
MAWTLAVVVIMELAYALQFDPHNDGLAHVFGFALDGHRAAPWCVAVACCLVAVMFTRRARFPR